MAEFPLVPVNSYLTLPRYVYRHRIHSGYFLDQLMWPGFAAERERRLAKELAHLGWKEKERPEYLRIVDRRWRDVFGESTPGDTFRAVGEDPQEKDSEQARQVAVERMAAGLTRSWSTSPPLQAAIHDRAEREGSDWPAAKEGAAAVGVCLALGRMDTRQRIRFGNQYVVDAERRPVDVAPVTELGAVPFIRWLHRQAIAEAEATLLGEPPRHAPPTPGPETVPLEADLLREDVAAGRLDEIILMTEELEALLAAADLTPAERELVVAFRRTGEWPETARLLDISLPAMRMRKKRLLAKMPPD